MRTLAKLAWIEVKLFAREPIAVVFAVAFPLVVLGRPDGGLGVPGSVGVLVAWIGLIVLPVHLASLRERGVLRRLRASSVSVTGVFTAQAAVHVALAALGGAVLLAAASLVEGVPAPSSVAGVALGFGVGSLSFVALGFLLGSLAPSARVAQALGLVLFFPMWLLSGAGPPPGVLTETMRPVGDVLPLASVVTAIQEPWLGTGSNLSELARLSALAAAALGLCVWRNAEGSNVLAMPRRRP